MSDFNEIINSDKPTLVDFWANWCSPCRTMTPIIEETKSELGDKANVLKVNVDDNKEVSVKYNVRSIPTVILFKNGNPVWRQSGVVQKNVLINEVNKVV
tara:strand:- start:2623 stop:2919 length:297 start_codon:yes stop_codon:yes gene_type:complete